MGGNRAAENFKIKPRRAVKGIDFSSLTLCATSEVVGESDKLNKEEKGKRLS